MEKATDTQQTGIDKLWAAEGESRIDAYEAGLLESIQINEVFEELENARPRDEGTKRRGDDGTL